jgi:hypothetical protein
MKSQLRSFGCSQTCIILDPAQKQLFDHLNLIENLLIAQCPEGETLVLTYTVGE